MVPGTCGLWSHPQIPIISSCYRPQSMTWAPSLAHPKRRLTYYALSVASRGKRTSRLSKVTHSRKRWPTQWNRVRTDRNFPPFSVLLSQACDSHSRPSSTPTLIMSVPHALEAAHNALISKYKENEATIRSLRKALHEDIIPNVLDEMNEGGTQYDMQDLEDWANDTGVKIRMNESATVITPWIIQDPSFAPSRFVPLDSAITGPLICLRSVTNTRPLSPSKPFAIH